MKRLKYDDVKSFVEGNSSCKLISTEYKNIDSKMTFRCFCGEEFETTFYKFDKRDKKQCNKCGGRGGHNKLTFDQVKKYVEVESGTGCKLLSTEYENANEQLKFMCKCGNTFETKLGHFKNGIQKQCRECGFEIRAKSKRLDKEYVKSIIESKGCKLLNAYKNANTRIRIQCSCGNEFETLFLVFRDYDVNMCGICRNEANIISKGELKIEKWLFSNNIEFKAQYRIEGCRNERELPFDFAVFENNELKTLIEYDGKQHFGLGNFTSDQNESEIAYEQVKKHDRIKNEFCLKNRIPLLRISYNEYKNINEILTSSLL